MAKTNDTKNSTRDQLLNALSELKAKRDTLTASFKKELDERFAEHRKQIKALRDEREKVWKEYNETMAAEKAAKKQTETKAIKGQKTVKKDAVKA